MDKTFLAHGEHEWGVGYNPEGAAAGMSGEFDMWHFQPKPVENAYVDPETGQVVVEWLPSFRAAATKKELKLMSNDFFMGRYKWEDYMGHKRLVKVK